MSANVVRFQIRLIGMETVGVFHREFSGADQSGSGACFIPVFGLDLVNHHRQLFVTVDFGTDQCGDALLVSHCQKHRFVIAVIEAEQFGSD